MDLGAIPHRLDERKSASDDAGPKDGWIVMSHIGWGGEQITLYKVWKPSPSRRILKSRGEARKGKSKEANICGWECANIKIKNAKYIIWIRN